MDAAAVSITAAAATEGSGTKAGHAGVGGKGLKLKLDAFDG